MAVPGPGRQHPDCREKSLLERVESIGWDSVILTIGGDHIHTRHSTVT
ncbi:hypothetical protein [Amycolatopsis cihanbeyliensis]|uniref:Uncharacterized protein n=1 Tax=Amycolatopsis cihanbeyliensis TaxID=1128664 RepID=A0A542DF49_AMYCI|nr:hypothetical protein [Amycolatopsis cihanbeyliensis]TQJ01701.1 hypothetical protein FB471_1409 [Amycolatopsis cihanbeyliensis]